MKPTLIPLIIILISGVSFAQSIPSVTSGSIRHFENYPSQFVAPRNIDVWLPEGYTRDKKYAVLYMHDGQMLYDTAITWDRQSWDVDDIASKLLKEKKVHDFIVVGIWNTPLRHAEYFPQKPFESLSPELIDTVTRQLQRATRTKDAFHPVSDNYLKFIITELKPMIDTAFSVFTDRAHTFISGSSMGGLISMYAVCEYPEVFGGAACLSTHWPGTFAVENNPVPDAFVNYMKQHLPDPASHKFYFDYGDQTLDAMYAPLQIKVDEVMKARGFTQKNWITRCFPGMNHSENSWKARFDIPLMFLLAK